MDKGVVQMVFVWLFFTHIAWRVDGQKQRYFKASNMS
jgi:hypothetical protein